MEQIGDFFRKLVDTADFPARWHCGEWSDFHGWLYIISDLLIWAAYFAIPLLIIWFITHKKHKLRFNRIYLLFAAFILFCGVTHFLDAVIFWNPVYRLSALARLATAIVSWATVFALIRLLPKAFSLKSPDELEAEVEKRKRSEEVLRLKNEELRKIAWMQSHELRGPLSTILMLLTTYEHVADNNPEKNEIIRGIKTSADNLDAVIHKIVTQTESIEQSREHPND